MKPQYSIKQSGLSRRDIRALILDMDGVLWRGTEAIGDLHAIFDQVSKNGWSVMFATNNGSRTIQQYVDLLASFGVSVSPWQVITSSIAAANLLCQKYPKGGPVYIVGEEGVVEACKERGFFFSEANALAVIAGIDRGLTYNKLKIASSFIRAGALFIGTNPDRTFPTPQGLVPGAGAILAAITAATDVAPIIVGKPEPAMYQIALERLHASPAEVLAVGDRPETDIVGAQALGCHTALVLTGVTDANRAYAFLPAPDMIVKDLESLVTQPWDEQIEANSHLS